MEEENVKREASYGVIRLSRAQIGGGGQFFFGSKVRVTNSIFLEINNAEIVTDHGEQRVRDAGGAPYTAVLIMDVIRLILPSGYGFLKD